MFKNSLLLYILSLPLHLLAFMGTPFKFKSDSNLRGLDDYEIKAKYNKQKERYHEQVTIARIITTVVLLAMVSFLVVFPSWFFWVFSTLFTLLFVYCVFFDGLGFLSKYFFAVEEAKKTEGGNALVVLTTLKDDSIEDALAKRNKDREDYKKSREESVSLHREAGGFRD